MKNNLCLSCSYGERNQILTKERKLERTNDCFCLNTDAFAEHAKKEALIYPLLMVNGVTNCKYYSNEELKK